MEKIVAVLRLKPLAVVFALLALLGQGVLFSSVCTTFAPGGDERWQTTYSFGLGSPIEIITKDGGTHIRIRWIILAVSLAATWLLAAGAATVVEKAAGLRRPATVYALVAVVMIAIAFMASIGISKSYWGYFLQRPELLTEADQISRVRAVVAFKTASGDSSQHELVPDAEFLLAEYVASGKKDPYYCLDERIVLALERRNLLPAGFAATLDGLPELYPLIRGSGLLAKSSKGYDSEARLQGIVVDATGSSGDRLVFLCLYGGEVSNDHRPYYELLFHGRPDGSSLTFVRGQRFFYDVAGMEGFEWGAMWLLFAVPSIIVGFLIFTLARFIRGRRERKHLLIAGGAGI